MQKQMLGEQINNKEKKSLTSMKIDVDFFVHLFCFISVLFIGADKFGIDVGVNIRLDQVFLLFFAFFLFLKNGFKLYINWWMCGFALFTLISALIAFNLMRGIIFYFSIIYNVIFLFLAFANYVHIYGIDTFINVFRKTLYVQVVIFVVQFALKVVFDFEFSFLPSYGEYMGVPRFNLWFYEPSYFATYVIFWFAMSCYLYFIGKDKDYLKDIFLSLILLVLSTSTSGFIGIALVLVCVYFRWIKNGISVVKISVLLGSILAIVVFSSTSVFEVFVGRLFNSSLNDASGGRVEGWLQTFKVFKENPLFGVGPGNYGLYLGLDAGEVPSNVTLELMATTGVFSTVCFYGLFLWLYFKGKKFQREWKREKNVSLDRCVLRLQCSR